MGNGTLGLYGTGINSKDFRNNLLKEAGKG